MAAASTSPPQTTDWEAVQASWDAQQEGYLPARQERLRLLADLAGTRGTSPVVLDLACGTGSVARAVLRAVPGARVVAVDADPVLLEIARRTVAADDRVRLVEADLRDPGWTAALQVDRVDAVLSSTALHWLAEDRTRGLYAEIAALLPAGGLFADADHTPLAAGPAGELAAALSRARSEAAWAAGTPDWERWWAQLRDVPELAGPLAARAAVYPDGHSEGHAGDAGWRLQALREAGFRDAAVVWQHLDDAITVGVR